MACLRLYNKCLPFPNKFVRFPRWNGKGADVGHGQALHSEHIEGTYRYAILFSLAAAAVDEWHKLTRFRLTLARTSRRFHKRLDACRYTQHE